MGHSGICPCCGDEHDEQETMTCAECFNERRTCADCGYSFNENDMYLIGDDYYCEDCCSRCEECGDLCPNNELEYISGFGSVCDSCLENRDEFEQCYWCDEWVRIGTEDAVTTSDGTTFCCGEEEDMCSYRKQENTNVRKIVLNAKNAESMYWTMISTLKKAYAVDV